MLATCRDSQEVSLTVTDLYWESSASRRWQLTATALWRRTLSATDEPYDTSPKLPVGAYGRKMPPSAERYFTLRWTEAGATAFQDVRRKRVSACWHPARVPRLQRAEQH